MTGWAPANCHTVSTPPPQGGGDFCSGGGEALPEVWAEVGAFPSPGQEGEDDVAGLGMGAAVYAAREVAHQVHEGVEAENGLAHAGHEHPGHIEESVPSAGRFAGSDLVEIVAEFHGEVAEAEYGEGGL